MTTFKYIRSVTDPTNDEAKVRDSAPLLVFTWAGGPYIDVTPYGWSQAAKEVINVWDYAGRTSSEDNKPTIARTQEAFEAKCNEWVAEYGAGDLVHDIIWNWMGY